MSFILKTASLLVAVLVIFSSNQVGAATFSDGSFGDHWSYEFIAARSFSQPPPMGDSFGSINTVMDPDTGEIYNHHQHTIYFGQVLFTIALNTLAVYDPGSSGAIDSLTFSIDFRGDPDIGGGSSFVPILEQNSTLYFGFGPVLTNDDWATSTTTLTELDFFTNVETFEVDMPDFNAGPITFGYALGNTQNGVIDPLMVNYGVDNWSVTVNPVPLPGAFWLMLSALVGGRFLKQQKS